MDTITFEDRAKMQPTGERRPPRKGEHFLTEKSRSQYVAAALCDFTSDRDLVALPPKDYEYTGEFRQARERESFLYSDGEVLRWQWPFPTSQSYAILRKVPPKPSTFKPGAFLPATGEIARAVVGPGGAKNLQYTGEYRLAKSGEYYLRDGVAYRANSGSVPRPPRPILATPPKGYEFVGKSRVPQRGEFYLGTGKDPLLRSYDAYSRPANPTEYRPILRLVETTAPPKPEVPNYSETDALVWASKFADLIRDDVFAPSDVGTLTAWFATAIEAGRTAGQGEIADVRRRLTVARRERDDAKRTHRDLMDRNIDLRRQIDKARSELSG